MSLFDIDSEANMLLLHRRDPRMHMARFYGLSLETSLFGDTLLVRQWGRIGTRGRSRFDWFDSPAAAGAELARIALAKMRRGYRDCRPQDAIDRHIDAIPRR